MAKNYLDIAGLTRFWNDIKGQIGHATGEQVNAWLGNHPEATTTVQDNSINGATKIINGSIPDSKLAQSGGVLEDVSDLQDGIEELTDDIEELEYNVEALNAAKAEVFTEVQIGTKVNEIAGMTRQTGIATAAANYININTSSGFDTYYKVVEKKTILWFEDISSNYVALVYGINYTSTSTSETYTRLYCSDSVRLRASDNNLPTRENPVTIPAGGCYAVNVTAGGQDLVYGLETELVVKTDFANDVAEKANLIPKKLKLVYDDTSGSGITERLNIYQPLAVGYAKWDFAHCVLNNKNSNCWTIRPLYAVDDSLANRYAITTSGEFECALKINDRSDFMGGFAHGDEIATSIKVFIDGAEIDPEDITELTSCDEIRVIEQSNLYDPNDSETLAAIHGKEYIWTKEKLIINQSVTWQNSYAVNSSYLAMLPAAKSATDYISNDDSYGVHPFSEGYFYKNSGVTEAVLWSETLGLVITMSIPRWLIQGSNLVNVGKFTCTDNDNNDYNKCYFFCEQTGNVVSGTLWKTTTEYDVRINK